MITTQLPFAKALVGVKQLPFRDLISPLVITLMTHHDDTVIARDAIGTCKTTQQKLLVMKCLLATRGFEPSSILGA